MTTEEMIAYIESHGFVVSRAKRYENADAFCIWDPQDDLDNGFCIRGTIEVVREAYEYVRTLKDAS